MKREQFIQDLRKRAGKAGYDFEVLWSSGKGGHVVVRCGKRQTVIKSGEITPIYERIVRKQLELE